MLVRDITYEDLDKKIVTKPFYFNLTAAEIIELEASFEGGLEAGIKRIAAAGDNETLIKEFKRVIMMTYGIRDGDDFIKTEDLRVRFASSNAYSALFMEFLANTDSLTEFIAGVMPQAPVIQGKPVMPPPPSPMEVARVTEQQKAMGQAIIEGNANG